MLYVYVVVVVVVEINMIELLFFESFFCLTSFIYKLSCVNEKKEKERNEKCV